MPRGPWTAAAPYGGGCRSAGPPTLLSEKESEQGSKGLSGRSRGASSRPSCGPPGKPRGSRAPATLAASHGQASKSSPASGGRQPLKESRRDSRRPHSFGIPASADTGALDPAGLRTSPCGSGPRAASDRCVAPARAAPRQPRPPPSYSVAELCAGGPQPCHLW